MYVNRNGLVVKQDVHYFPIIEGVFFFFLTTGQGFRPIWRTSSLLAVYSTQRTNSGLGLEHLRVQRLKQATGMRPGWGFCGAARVAQRWVIGVVQGLEVEEASRHRGCLARNR